MPRSPAGPRSLIGIAEWRIAAAEAGAAPTAPDVGYWALVVAGGLGVLVLARLARPRRPRRPAGLDPWIAALGAVSFLIAAGGPLIPRGHGRLVGQLPATRSASTCRRCSSSGAACSSGCSPLCGVVGFLLVRRYGLGLAVGGAIAAGWLLATAATDQTPARSGPATPTRGSLDLEPARVTIVGFALVGFFALVAVVMALLDADR